MENNPIRVSRKDGKIVVKPSTESIPVQIAKGVFNRVFHTDNVEELSEYRLSICKGDENNPPCPLFKNYICDKTNYVAHINTGKPVAGCGCRLKEKTRNYNSSCPALKWGAYDSEADYLSEKEIKNT